MTEPAVSSPSPRAWPDWLVWSGAVACAVGLVLHRMWLQVPAGRFGESLLLALLAALLAAPLVRWRRMSWVNALASAWLLALVAMSGPAAVLAVVLLVAAAAALGSVLVGATRPAWAITAGLGLLAAGVGWTLALPVHRSWLYAPVLLLLIAWRRQALSAMLGAARVQWCAAVAAGPKASAWTVTLLGMAGSAAWLPTMQFDDVAYHLGLPWQLLVDGRYALDPTHQVWALAPWAGDVLQAIAQVLAGGEARGPLNVVWQLLTCAGLWQLGGALGLRGAMRWGTLALFASLPLTAGLLGGMQTETPATAVTVLLAALVVSRIKLDSSGPAPRAADPQGDATAQHSLGDAPAVDGDAHNADLAIDPRRALWLAAVLFGLLAGLKPLHALVALPLLAATGWRFRAGWSIGTGVVAAALLIVVGGSSYVHAAWIAGNPILPLFNGVFGSPYFAPADFRDARWTAGFDAALPWDLTFHTSRYLEGFDGGAGFVLVALAGALLVALWRRETRLLALCGLVGVLMPLLPAQYARYAHPGVVLLLAPMVAVLQPVRLGRALLVGLCVLNAAFHTNSQWMLHTGAVKRSVAALGRDVPMLVRYVPERVIAAAIRAQGPHTGAVLVLDPQLPAYAELGRRGRTTAWYDPRLEAAGIAADADTSGETWAGLFRRHGIAEVIVRPASLTPAQRAGLNRANARHALTVGEAQWWRLPSGSRR